jgi:hypothetical protein
MNQLQNMIQIVDSVDDHHLADDEVVSQVDEVEDDEVEEVGNVIYLNHIKQKNEKIYNSIVLIPISMMTL